ncbi:MAG TPA: T9SS type A sorting domain-containing protein [Paludibacter sp.]
MKQFIPFFMLLFVVFRLSAYDYQTVYSHRTLIFETSYQQVEALFIDSVKFQKDSLIFPMRNIQLVGDGCYTPYGASWLGNKIIINKQWNYFFNDENDTIKIKTDAQLKETWNLFKRPDITITATLEKWDTCTVLGIKDSLKTIVLHVFDMSMSPVPHKLEGRTIEINKHYGLVSSVNFTYFPSLKFIPTGNISDKFILVGITNPNLGIQNMTWFDAYDFHDGDEFHYTNTNNHLMFGGSASSSKQIVKILSRQNFTDSIKYVQDVETSTDFKQNSTSDYITNYKHEQTNIVIRRNDTFDAYPGVLQFLNHSANAVSSIMIGSVKTTDQNYYVRNLGNCWVRPMLTDDACNYVSYERGLGLVYSGGGCWPETIGYDEYKLVYYNKGSTTWGAPLVISGIDQPEAKPDIAGYPNPTNDKVSISPDFLAEPCYFELMDVRGIVILRTEVDTNRNTVNLSGFSNGLYLYRLLDKGKLLKTGKIVKM